MKKISLTLVVMLGLTACSTSAQQSSTSQPSHYEQLASLSFHENRPTPETAKSLSDEMFFQRATQTYLWALPLINTLGMKTGSEKVFGAATTSFRFGRNDSTPKRSLRLRTPMSSMR
jgi:hypothetical protein